MTKAEREAHRADAERKAGKTVTPKAEAAEAAAIAKTRAKNLDDPKTQSKIELPKTIEIVLVLPEVGRKEALISTEFTHEQIYDWNLFEDLQSFSQLIIGELQEKQFQSGDTGAYTAAMTTSRVRTAVRRVLSKITRYKEEWSTYDSRDREIRHIRPTEEELREGIVVSTGEPNLFAMRQFADILFGMYSEEVERQKNARAAGVPG